MPLNQAASSTAHTQPLGQGPPVSEAPGGTPVNGVTVRFLQDTPEDASFAAKLTVEAFRNKFATNITEEKLPIAVKNVTASHRGQYDSFYRRSFVAEQDGRRLGFLMLRFHGEKEKGWASDHISELGLWHALRYACSGLMMQEKVDEGKCYLDHICVHEDARGKGVGKLLMERAEFEARTRKCKTIYLAVTTTNRAQNLYERLGYKLTRTKSMFGFLGWFIGPPGKFHYMEKRLV